MHGFIKDFTKNKSKMLQQPGRIMEEHPTSKKKILKKYLHGGTP